jgi:hypothetical protein
MARVSDINRLDVLLVRSQFSNFQKFSLFPLFFNSLQMSNIKLHTENVLLYKYAVILHILNYNLSTLTCSPWHYISTETIRQCSTPKSLELFDQNKLNYTQRPSQWATEALSRGVNRTGREADHSPPSSAEFKNAWSYVSIPPYVFMAWCLFKHRANFTLL